MSALPAIADIGTQLWSVCFVPKADIALRSRRALDLFHATLFEPLLVEDALLVGKYEIPFGDQDDDVLGRFRRVGCSCVKELIAFNTPGPMGDVRVSR